MAFLSQPGIVDEIRTRYQEPINAEMRYIQYMYMYMYYTKFGFISLEVSATKLCHVKNFHTHAYKYTYYFSTKYKFA